MAAGNNPGAIMTVRDVSEYMRVHPSTIYRALKEGEIKSFKMGSDHRFRKADIDDWIDKQVKGSTN